ncbi:MAG: phenylalanine--tRNA ligase subunit alpha [Candidatus Omnitrophica bacterium]|nr:phenylalanine--tRNA ligase subunit alpha [Candidatus Omnitrophota bacterium]
MEEEIRNLEKLFLEDFSRTDTPESLEVLKARYLGRKGRIAEYFQKISSLSADKKPTFGKLLNETKEKINALIIDKESSLSRLKKSSKSGEFDITLPGLYFESGHKHVLSRTIDEISSIFYHLGFVSMEGPEAETEYYNFQALNIPPEHPAHDAFNTFYLDVEGKEKYLLRSQTSTVQIRVMEKHKPPLRVISPGRVYRPDATDASHSFMFHQIEGFAVDKKITFSDLKGTLFAFATKFFGRDLKMRFRPHHFPFTEPSVEVDISCIICKRNHKPVTSNQKSCSVCHGKGWLEILGAGMIHPNVFRVVGYDPNKYTGFAFGMGVERIAMLKYGIEDIRLFFENDLRFLKQF